MLVLIITDPPPALIKNKFLTKVFISTTFWSTKCNFLKVVKYQYLRNLISNAQTSDSESETSIT